MAEKIRKIFIDDDENADWLRVVAKRRASLEGDDVAATQADPDDDDWGEDDGDEKKATPAGLLDDSELEEDVFSAVCTFCGHWDETKGRKCAAFPDGIPDEIWMGEDKHETPRPGSDIAFVPVEKVE